MRQKKIIFEKITDCLIENYDYYKIYNPNRSKFSTYLYKDIFFISIKVLREENLNYDKFILSIRNFKIFLKSFNITLTNDSYQFLNNENAFNSRKEINQWLSSQISEKDFSKYQNEIWNYVIRKENYREKFVDYSDQQVPIVNSQDVFNQDKIDILLVNECRKFLLVLNKVEKDPFFRLVLKMIMNLNINYLNCEIIESFRDVLSLNLLESVQVLNTEKWSENKTEFYKSINDFLKNFSDKAGNIKAESIQQRIYRCFEKISKLYTRSELKNILDWFGKNFDINLLEINPVFLSLRMNNSEMFSIKYENIKTVKILDLKNNNLSEIPQLVLQAKSLEELNLNNNNFCEIPKELFSLNKLRLIILDKQRSYIDESSINAFRAEVPNCKLIV